LPSSPKRLRPARRRNISLRSPLYLLHETFRHSVRREVSNSPFARGISASGSGGAGARLKSGAEAANEPGSRKIWSAFAHSPPAPHPPHCRIIAAIAFSRAPWKVSPVKLCVLVTVYTRKLQLRGGDHIAWQDFRGAPGCFFIEKRASLPIGSSVIRGEVNADFLRDVQR